MWPLYVTDQSYDIGINQITLYLSYIYIRIYREVGWLGLFCPARRPRGRE